MILKRIIVALALASLALVGPSRSQIGPPPLVAPLPKAICSIGVQIFLTTTGGTPSTWINTTFCNTFKVEVLSGGGGASTGIANVVFGAAACGGGYAKKNTLSVSPGASAGYSVGVAGTHGASNTNGNPGGDSWFCSSTGSCASAAGAAVVAAAKGGPGGTVGTSGCPAPSTTGFVGDVANAGGGGGNTQGGGGGAGGPNGAGNTGVTGAAGGVGGAGGSADAGSGGAGGSAGNTTPTAGGAGAAGTEFDASHGAGGGGGGGGSSGPTGANSGAGGQYGGGGGGPGQGATTDGVGGDGFQGLIVLTPLSALVPANDNNGRWVRSEAA